MKFIDDDDILKDGQTLRVPMIMRDGAPNPRLSPTQLAIAATRDAMTFDASLHRPGHRYANDAAPLNDAQRLRYGVFDAAKEKAYADRDRDLTNSWRGNTGAAPPAGSYPEGTSHEGRACTVDGSPGTLRAIAGNDGWLQCRPTNRTDAQPTNDAREAAYQDYESRLQNAWRNAS